MSIQNIIPLVLLHLAILSSVATAQSAISCHCFQDRSFNAEMPEKVDPYLLATAQNSFIAEVFGIEKRGIVQAKMQGADSDLIWISNFLTSITGEDVSVITHRLTKGWSGKELIAELKLDPESMAPNIWLSLIKDNKGSNKILTQSIVDDAVVSRLGIAYPLVKKMRSAGAGNKELILSAIIAKRTGRDISDIYAGKSTNTSWGYIANLAGIIPMDVDDLLKQMVSSAK